VAMDDALAEGQESSCGVRKETWGWSGFSQGFVLGERAWAGC
jgi:hypothetical protein